MGYSPWGHKESDTTDTDFCSTKGYLLQPRLLRAQKLAAWIFLSFLRFFFMWTIFKVFTEFVSILLPLYVLIFWGFFWGGHEICGILVSQPRIKPASPELEGKVLIPGPPAKSQAALFS